MPYKTVPASVFGSLTCVLKLCPDPCVWFAVGAPSPAGHLGTAGVWGEEGQHGDSRARSREQHLLLRIAVPRRLQDAKAAHSHTA